MPNQKKQKIVLNIEQPSEEQESGFGAFITFDKLTRIVNDLDSCLSHGRFYLSAKIFIYNFFKILISFFFLLKY